MLSIFEGVQKCRFLGTGIIEKYEMAVFYLNVAGYNDLVDPVAIEKHTGFSKLTLEWNPT